MRWLTFLLIAIAGVLASSPAIAQVCTALTTSVAPASATLSTYSPIGTPVAFTLGVQVTNSTLLPCPIGLTFNGPSSPANMTSGAAQLAYTIKDTSDVTTLLYVGASPGSNYLSTTAGVGTTTINVHVVAIAGQFTARAGSYSDNSVSIQVFTRLGGVLVGLAASATLTVSTTVTKICSIGGTTTPGADSATIPISGTGAVNTTPIPKAYASAICNAPTNITLSSGNSGVKSATPAAGGFTNVIGYSASATLGGATGTLDTVTSPATTGVISSPGGASGTLSVVITPQTPALPLVRGSYSDVLSIALTPQ